MRFFFRAVCALLVAPGLLAGCGVTITIDPSAGAPPPSPAGTAAVSAPTPEATPAPAPTLAAPTPTVETGAALPAGVLVRYERRGCYAGIVESLVIDADGSAALTATRGETARLTLSESQQRELRQALDSPAFQALDQPPLPAGADQCVYRITTDTDSSMSRTVVSLGESGDPAPLAAAVDILERIRVLFPIQCSGRCR